jgi:hypothetical protein
LIPKVAHFIWLGRELAWVHRLALVSAARHGGFERVCFHHDGTLETRVRDELGATPGLEMAAIDAQALVEAAGGSALVDCYRELATPAARVNVLRMALLAERGGVYLDTDTVTLQSFAPLCERGGAFCGEERLVFPGANSSWLARLHPAALARMAVRDAFRRLPNGYVGFRAVERFYPTAVNNAVLGSEPGHPLVRELVARAVRLPQARRKVRYALGTHLLQAVVADFRGPTLAVLPPPVFYPLGPEISEHWFRARRVVELERALTPETLLVHWYASVRTRAYVSHIDAAYVREHARTQLFSALAERALAP